MMGSSGYWIFLPFLQFNDVNSIVSKRDLLRNTKSIISDGGDMKILKPKRLNPVTFAYNYPFISVRLCLPPTGKPFKTKRIITMESIKNTYKSFVFHLHRKSINHFECFGRPCLHLQIPLPLPLPLLLSLGPCVFFRWPKNVSVDTMAWLNM